MSCCIFNILRWPQLHPKPFMAYLSPYVLLLQFLYTSLPNCLCPFFKHDETTIVYTFVCNFLCLPTPGDLSNGQKTFYRSLSHYTSTVPSSCHFLFFHCPGFTTIENNTPDTGLENFTFCVQEHLGGK